MRRLKTGLTAFLILVAGGILGYLMESWLSNPPSSQFLPLQMTASSYSKSEAAAWRERLLRTQGSIKRAPAGHPPELTDESYDLLIALAMEKPRLLSDPDLAATAARMVALYADLPKNSRNKAEADTLCMAFRWTPARLQSLAESCRKTLEGGHISSREPLIQKAPNALLLVAAERELHRSTEALLSNPYEPQVVYDLALELNTAGRDMVADRLYDELVQLDGSMAAKLQSKLAEANGLRHQSHKLK